MTSIGFLKKIRLLILAFTAPICLLAVLVFQSRSEQIDFALQEKKGVDAQRLIMKAYTEMLQLELLLSEKNVIETNIESETKSSLEPKTASKENSAVEASPSSNQRLQNNSDLLKIQNQEAQKQLAILEADFKNRPEFWKNDLGFADETLNHYNRPSIKFSELNQNIEHLKEALKKDSLVIKTISLFNQQLKLALTHITDTSNLILDPDLDSFYVMDSTSNILPRIADRFSTAYRIKLTQSFSRKAQLKESDYPAELYKLKDFLTEIDIDALVYDLQFALKTDSEFNEKSESLQRAIPFEIEKIKSELIPRIENLSSPLPVTGQGIISEASRPSSREGLQFLEKNYQIWLSLHQELEMLLKIRIDHLSFRRTIDLSLAGLSWIIITALSLLSVSRLSRKVSDLTLNLNHTGLEVNLVSQNIKTNSLSLSQSSLDSAAALEQSVAATEELSSMITLTAQHSSQVHQITKDAVTLSQNGLSHFLTLEQQMELIHKESQKIEQIVALMDDVTFQINLLALNAAVEAARAGEQGRGFAVVADSVRSLAQKSATSAKDIHNVIGANSKIILQSQSLAKECSINLKKINGSIENISKMNEEIATSAQEQSAGLNQLFASLNDIDKKTQTNAQSSENLAASSIELESQSSTMKDLVESITLLIEGTSEPTNSIKQSSLPLGSAPEKKEAA